MPYFAENVPYFCQKCKEWYYHSGQQCLVKHVPGTCCHQYEIKSDVYSKNEPKQSNGRDLQEI